MKKLFFFILMLTAAIFCSYGQEEDPDFMQRATLSPETKLYKGKYHFVEEQTGDTVCMVVFNPIYVLPQEKFKNSKEEQFYWKTVRDVKRTLPYAKLICVTLLETYEYIETFPTQKEREEYLKEMEGEIFKQYKPIMKTFTKSQGKMLLKLINRETHQSSYHIVKAFLGSFRAGFWQGFGRLFGVNMKVGYDPKKDETDAMIERICIRVEQNLI